MLNELSAAALFGLIICQYYLIRGCFGINEAIGSNGGEIQVKIDRTADLLDEVAQLISDFSDGIAPEGNIQPPTSPMEAIFTSLISKMTMPQTDTDASQEEWSLYEAKEYTPNPKETENEFDPVSG